MVKITPSNGISIWIILDFDPSQVTEEMVSPLLAMGFDEKDSINALVKFKGDAAGAIEALTSGADLTPPSKKGKKVRIADPLCSISSVERSARWS